MSDREIILSRIKQTVHSVAPDATVILYGSYARGEENEESDIDLLILVNEEVNDSDTVKIQYPLFDLGFETGNLISPMVHFSQIWEKKYAGTPFYESVMQDAVYL